VKSTQRQKIERTAEEWVRCSGLVEDRVEQTDEGVVVVV
jgi:hypothetical protein